MMKRKVVSPDIQIKKKQQAQHKQLEKDVKQQLQEDIHAYPKATSKIRKHKAK